MLLEDLRLKEVPCGWGRLASILGCAPQRGQEHKAKYGA